LVNLRARIYDPSLGRFLSRDVWGGNNTQPMSYNDWLYGYANPIIWTDPTGFSAVIYGIQVDDNFTDDEKSLISKTLSDYLQLFGSQQKMTKNLALSAIKQGWTNSEGKYNAQYNWITHTITIQPGWFSPVYTQTPDGKFIIVLAPLCGEELEKIFSFPKGSLPTAKIGAQFVLAHEIGHSFQIGNPDAFQSFINHVDLPWSIFAGLSKNPLIQRNAFRDVQSEVFADMMAAYLYSPGLLNQQMSDWIHNDMPAKLK
jgi:hypothetical protein